jgi:hypothetical protein
MLTAVIGGFVGMRTRSSGVESIAVTGGHGEETGSPGEPTKIPVPLPCWMTLESESTPPRYRIPVGFARGEWFTGGPYHTPRAFYSASPGSCGWRDEVSFGDPGFVADNDIPFEIFLTNVWGLDHLPGVQNAFKFRLAVQESPCAAGLPPACISSGTGSEDSAWCPWDAPPLETTQDFEWQEGIDAASLPFTDCHRPEVFFAVAPGRLGERCYMYTVGVSTCSLADQTACGTETTELGCFKIIWND